MEQLPIDRLVGSGSRSTELVVGLLRIQNSILTKPLKPKALVNTLSQLLSTQNHKNHSQKSAKNTQYFN